MDPTILRDEAEGLEELNEHHRWEAVLAAKVAAASALRRAADEIEWLTARLQEIIDQAHYPDATIARRALRLPVTARDDEQRLRSCSSCGREEPSHSADVCPYCDVPYEQEMKKCPWCKTVHTGACSRLISGGQSD